MLPPHSLGRSQRSRSCSSDTKLHLKKREWVTREISQSPTSPQAPTNILPLTHTVALEEKNTASRPPAIFHIWRTHSVLLRFVTFMFDKQEQFSPLSSALDHVHFPATRVSHSVYGLLAQVNCQTPHIIHLPPKVCSFVIATCSHKTFNVLVTECKQMEQTT